MSIANLVHVDACMHACACPSNFKQYCLKSGQLYKFRSSLFSLSLVPIKIFFFFVVVSLSLHAGPKGDFSLIPFHPVNLATKAKPKLRQTVQPLTIYGELHGIFSNGVQMGKRCSNWSIYLN